MLTAILLSFVGIGMICWLLFKLAVNALPFFAALSMGMFAYNTGAGPIGAMVFAALAGAIAFLAGPLLFATVRSPEFRTLISAAYAVPAGLAGYHAVYAISAIGGTAEPCQSLHPGSIPGRASRFSSGSIASGLRRKAESIPTHSRKAIDPNLLDRVSPTLR